MYMDNGRTGTWALIFNINDESKGITQEGYSGIRTDFMDVEFEDFSMINV